MKITKLLGIALIGILGFGQQNSVQLPSFDLPTPEAYAFQKQIDIPVSHYTGIPTINIPIYNINSGNISVPVGLSYNAQGIRVDEIATRFGLGWNLQAGGAIVREVKDKVDEFNYLNPNSQFGYFNFDNIVNDRAKLIAFHDLYFSNPQTTCDLEPDLFSFNCGGLSGKFFFDQTTKLPVFQSFEDLKIEVIWNGTLMDGFIITDTQGTAYYFGKNKLKTITGIEKSEQIATEYYNFKTGELYTGNATGGETRIKWDLLEIIDTNGNIVTFTYDFEQLKYKKRMFDGPLSQGPPSVDSGDVQSIPLVSMYGQVNGLQRFLRKIEFKNGKVEFVSATAARLDMGPPSTLSSISPRAMEFVNVYDKKDNLITSHKLNFEYIESNDISNTLAFYQNEPKKRLFLKSVQQTKEGVSLNPYEFVYSDIILPNRFSNAIDWWGFYNGMSNGISYFPSNTAIPNRLEYALNGGREVNPILMQAGLLKKVIYPTKGYSEYTYEANECKTPLFMTDTYNLFSNPTIPKSVNFFESDDFKTSPPGTPWYLQTYETPLFFVKRRYPNAFVGNSTYIYGSNQSGFGLEMGDPGSNPDTGLPFNLQLVPSNASNLNPPIPFNFPAFDLIRSTEAGAYTLKAQRIKEKQGAFNEFTMAMHWREEVIPSSEKMIIGGNRVKEIITVDNNGNQTKKRYEYNKKEPYDSFGITTSSGLLFGFEDLRVSHGTLPNTDVPIIGLSVNYLHPTPKNHAGYSEVTEFIESPNETHKIEYKFTKYVNEGQFYNYPLIPQTDNEWLRGKPLEVKYYKQNSPTDFSLIKEIITNYNIPNYVGSGWIDPTVDGYPSSANNVTILNQQSTPKEYYYSFVKPFMLSTTVPDIDFGHNGKIYKFKHYYIGGGVMNVKSVTEKEHLPTGIFETKTEYKYNSPIHNLLKEQWVTNSNNETLKSTFFYPMDPETATEPVVQGLKNQHKIGTPLVTQSFKGTEKLAEQKTIYKDWGNGILAPKEVKTAKGSAITETRVKYNVLDNTNGNPLEVQQEGGHPICYIWGYNKTLPIAKIENATYAQVQSYVANLQTLSNGTNEGNLITALDALRVALPNAMVTTYTHKPLIGLSTVTDPKGDKITYHYDNFNRLQFVKDKNENILSENEYHYKN
ncbi:MULTISPECIES: hypothetical protein [Flavobacterium]|uniref:YD repeat-containing protein n=1 Tax=Flavobacterium jumunjinense TaxID=998845 RepID=A0ABV5GPX3_9FLAO|nr:MULTISPECIES: hypothetical protein [Flavobacterium]